MTANDTTRKLEAYGREKGIRISVRAISGKKSDAYFLLSHEDNAFEPPKFLGSTVTAARKWIADHKFTC